MSVRGPRGGRGRGRGTVRGRGRGGKMTTWEWHNNYFPGAEVYDQLWHIRKAPATVTPFLPTECPLPNARTRIVDRRQAEGEIQRNFYVVQATTFTNREASVSSAEDAEASITEMLHVDLSRILEYVSADELERFENEQFRAEAEAEAVAMRVESEELKQRRLLKNAKAAATGQGSRMLSGLGLDSEARPRGRPRGRGRGRGRGSWRGRGAHVASGRAEDMREELVDAESEGLHRAEEDLQMMIAETDSEEDALATDSQKRASPNITRSAFVANSALPVSPILSHRRPSAIPIMQHKPIVASEDEEGSDLEPIDRDARSMSSAAMQFRIKDDVRGRSYRTSEDDGYGHRNKRRRTESAASREQAQPTKATFPERTRIQPYPSFANLIPKSPVGSEVPDDHIPSLEPIAVYRSLQFGTSNGMELDSIHVQLPAPKAQGNEHSEDNDDAEEEDAEEYVVEAIIEHYQDAANKYYLVKWQGYEDSHDWLIEADLEGAGELVAEYNEKVRRKKIEGK